MQMHHPVLLNETISQFDYLTKLSDGYFVDGTLGAGGHSLALARKSQFLIPNVKIIGVDKDQTALSIAKKNIDDAGLTDRFILVHDDFRNIKAMLSELEIDKIDGALLDLGISSMQIDSGERGFSFQNPEAPLDMRMNQDQKLTAADIVNAWPQGKLEKLLLEVGEEKFGRQIAKVITRVRKNTPLRTVGDLLNALAAAIPPRVRYDREKHYATNVFRALRIAVNDELDKLDRAITDSVDVLNTGGRLAVITFHSTEDRIVKNTFRSLENPCVCPPDLPTCVCGRKPIVKVLTKKPIGPSEEEIINNPRSRSAKLRVVERL